MDQYSNAAVIQRISQFAGVGGLALLPDDWVCSAALLCEKSSYFRLGWVPAGALAIVARAVPVWENRAQKGSIKKSLTTGGHASGARFAG
jgi:hypothetical protein